MGIRPEFDKIVMDGPIRHRPPTDFECPFRSDAIRIGSFDQRVYSGLISRTIPKPSEETLIRWAMDETEQRSERVDVRSEPHTVVFFSFLFRTFLVFHCGCHATSSRAKSIQYT